MPAPRPLVNLPFALYQERINSGTERRSATRSGFPPFNLKTLKSIKTAVSTARFPNYSISINLAAADHFPLLSNLLSK
jgi:hypothetical protein